MLGKIKIIFFGTPDFAAEILQSLIDNDQNIAGVFTQPDKKTGRRQEVAPSPVKKLAIDNDIPVFQPVSLKDDKLFEEIKKISADLFIVAAYGKILPREILDLPKYGAVNIHASLLPKHRGASPVQCAILSGDKETGITLMQMNEKMDEGDILMREKTEIGETETAETLLAKLSRLGAKMIADFIPAMIQGNIQTVPQEHAKAAYCKPIKREDGKITWNISAEEIYRKWRAFHPWPGIYSRLNLKNGPKRLKLVDIYIRQGDDIGEKPGKIIKYKEDIAVQTKRGLVILKKIQLEGKKEIAPNEFLKGYPEFIGQILE